MITSQLLLNAVLFTLIYAVALELRVDDFIGVARRPVPVLAGLAAQFLLLPVATFIATLLLALPATTVPVGLVPAPSRRRAQPLFGCCLHHPAD